MAKKGDIRSIRFSDAMIEMIESQAGENFTAKFEALVTRCMWELPAKEKELKQVQSQITQAKKRLELINRRSNELESTIRKITNDLTYTNIRVVDATKSLKQLIDEV